MCAVPAVAHHSTLPTESKHEIYILTNTPIDWSMTIEPFCPWGMCRVMWKFLDRYVAIRPGVWEQKGMRERQLSYSLFQTLKAGTNDKQCSNRVRTVSKNGSFFCTDDWLFILSLECSLRLVILLGVAYELGHTRNLRIFFRYHNGFRLVDYVFEKFNEEIIWKSFTGKGRESVFRNDDKNQELRTEVWRETVLSIIPWSHLQNKVFEMMPM